MTDGPADLAQDWITIWQSELSAAATDRERAQAWSGMVSQWADAARMAAQAVRQGCPDGPSGPAAGQPPVGAAPVAAAPDARDAAIERLGRRVDELERRLAGLHPTDRD